MMSLPDELRGGCVYHRKRWTGDTHFDLGGSIDEDATDALMTQAADRIEQLEAEVVGAYRQGWADAMTQENPPAEGAT